MGLLFLKKVFQILSWPLILLCYTILNDRGETQNRREYEMTINEACNTINGMNENELKAFNVICADCDELDGYGFTRVSTAILELVKAFDNNGHVAGGYFRSLSDKGVFDYEVIDDEIWVNRDFFEIYESTI